MKKPELLSPAGDPKKLIMPVVYGADAVYLSGKQYGLRASAGNFDDTQLEAALKYCRANNVKVYVTCNSILRNYEFDGLLEHLHTLETLGVDAVIAGDLGVLAVIKRHTRLPVHISTQMGVMNYETARMFYELGASRIVLARELTLEEIAQIRAKTPKELEFEAFVHGAMCVSFSGRCLLSNYMTGRDANRGECAQPCRWKYALMEEKRPGEYFSVFEESEGTYIMNSKDLCMIEYIKELTGAGISSLKIEGRMKSEYYAAVVTNAYRMAIDDAALDKPFDPDLLEEVKKVKHRGYYTGFYFGKTADACYYDNISSADWDIVAIVNSCDENGNAVLTQKNRFFTGDELELLCPGKKPVCLVVNEMRSGQDEIIDAARHPEMELKINIGVLAPPYSVLRKKRSELNAKTWTK